jgi:hypothetical protein
MTEYVNTLEESVGLTWNDDALEELQELIVEMVKVDVDTVPPGSRHVPTPDAESREAVLASWEGGQWTIGDYTDFLAELPAANRPVSRLPTIGLRTLIRRTQVQNELLYAEATRLGLDERPEVIDAATRIREQIMIELVHGRFIQEVDVPEEDTRALYDSTLATSPEALQIPERVDMMILVHTDEEIVREGLARIRRGDPEDKVVQELTIDHRTKWKGGRTGLIARGNYAPQIEDVAFSGRVGKGWSDPIVTESGTGALKVITHEEPRTATFDEVKASMSGQIASVRGEVAFEEWLQEQRNALGVVIHDDVLELIGQSVS